MTEKLHGLTKQEITRLQRAMRWVEDNASLLRPYRRIRGQQAGGGGIRHAYCKTAAGTGSTIQCYLDENLTGQEITVTCDLFSATSLAECLPALTAGKRIPVYSVNGTWTCMYWFIGVEACNV